MVREGSTKIAYCSNSNSLKTKIWENSSIFKILNLSYFRPWPIGRFNQVIYVNGVADNPLSILFVF